MRADAGMAVLTLCLSVTNTSALLTVPAGMQLVDVHLYNQKVCYAASLEVLGLDFTASVNGAFWAATLQRRMAGRCSVESASKYVNADGKLVGYANAWPKEDW